MKKVGLINNSALACVLLAACGSAPAPRSFGSSWRQVNAFTPQVQVLPFQTGHVYAVRPLDRTLKGLLQRWAKESGHTLDYRASADFTLSVQTADVHSSTLGDALSCLNAIYQPYGAELVLTADNGIVVTDIPATRSRPKKVRPACITTTGQPTKSVMASAGPAEDAALSGLPALSENGPAASALMPSGHSIAPSQQ